MPPKLSPIRYAVVGMGHIAQIAVLPAFAHSRPGSRVTAIFSNDPLKRKTLSRRYQIPAYPYSDYEPLLKSGSFDAVYIALPNSQHKEFVIAAAKAGVHILCEKPLAVTGQDAQAMVDAARKNNVLLMTGYRLHFEKTNLTAIQMAKSGKLGTVRFFNSIFSLNVKPGDIRTQRSLGGGSLYDLGIYCINAARYLFGADPLEVVAASAAGDDPRFRTVDEMTSAILRFPGNRLATFTSSLGASDTGAFSLVGTQGSLRADPAYEYASDLKLYVTIEGKTKTLTFPQRDQFAAELIHFSDCIRKKRHPEPSGQEGALDVRIIEALYQSARTKRWVSVAKAKGDAQKPTMQQEIHRPKAQKPELVHAPSASGAD